MMWPLSSPDRSACSFFIRSLMSEWPVAFMIGHAAVGLEHLRQLLRALDVEHQLLPRPVLLQQVQAVQQQQRVAADDLALVVDGADAVRVAVERHAQVRARAPSPWR